MTERIQVPSEENGEAVEYAPNKMEISKPSFDGGFLAEEFGAEGRRTPAEERQIVEETEHLLKGYYGFVSAVAGELAFIRQAHGPQAEEEIREHLETLAQGSEGYRDSLSEAIARLKAGSPLPAQATLARMLESCLVELEGAQIASLVQRNKAEIIEALENLVHVTRGSMHVPRAA